MLGAALLERLLTQFRSLDGQSEAVSSLGPAVEDEVERMVALALRTLAPKKEGDEEV